MDLSARGQRKHPALQGQLAVDRHVVRVVESRPEQDVSRGAMTARLPKARQAASVAMAATVRLAEVRLDTVGYYMVTFRD